MVSRRLGYRQNQLYRWESGRARVPWQELVRMCRVCRVDLADALRVVLQIETPPEDTAGLLTALRADATIGEIAGRLGCSRFTFSRWLHGKARLPVRVVLELIHTRRTGLADFIAALVDIERVPAVHGAYRHVQLLRELHIEHPAVGGVLRCLELPEYRRLETHQEGFVARHLGLSLEEEEDILAKLREARAIRQRQGKWEVVAERLSVPTGATPGRAARAYWTRRAALTLADITRPLPNSVAGYNVFTISEQGKREVLEKYYEFYHALRTAILEDQAEQDQIYVLNVQILALDDLTPEHRETRS